MYFPVDELSRLQSVLLKVFIFMEYTVKRSLYQNVVNFDRNNETFMILKFIFNQLRIRTQGQCVWCAVPVSKGRVYEYQRGRM